MAETLDCEIVTPEKSLFSSPATFVVLPGTEGEMGVLSKHVPLVSTLGTGEVRITLESGDIVRFAVSGGYVQVQAGDKVVVLADRAVQTDKIDREAVSAKAAELRSRLDSLGEDAPERSFVALELAWMDYQEELTAKH